MKTLTCKNCGRDLGQTDGEKICFETLGYSVCVELKTKHLPVICPCGKTVKLWRDTKTIDIKP